MVLGHLGSSHHNGVAHEEVGTCYLPLFLLEYMQRGIDSKRFNFGNPGGQTLNQVLQVNHRGNCISCFFRLYMSRTTKMC